MTTTSGLTRTLTTLLVITSVAQSAQWEMLPPTNEPRAASAITRVASRVYIAGGWDPSGFQGALASVEAFDSATHGWVVLPPMPDGRVGACAAAIGELVYVIGGSRPGGEEQQTVFVFDPQTGGWSSVAPLPARRVFATAASYGDRIYVFGGASGGAESSSTYAYNPTTDEWSSRAPMPTARAGHTTVVYGMHIFVIGGEQIGDRVLDVVERYDPELDHWTVRKPMPQRNAYSCAAPAGTRILTFGGINSMSTVRIYDPLEDAWFTGPPMLAPRWYLSAAPIFDRVLVVGGFDLSVQPTQDAALYLPQRAEGVEVYCLCESGAPCNNEFDSGGCVNGLGTGGRLEASGSVSIVADDLVLRGSAIPPLASAIGVIGRASALLPFGNGQLCVGRHLTRYRTGSADGNGELVIGPGIIASTGSQSFVPGRTIMFQVLYRDSAGPCSFGWNSTNALAATYAP